MRYDYVDNDKLVDGSRETGGRGRGRERDDSVRPIGSRDGKAREVRAHTSAASRFDSAGVPRGRRAASASALTRHVLLDRLPRIGSTFDDPVNRPSRI